MDTRRYVKHYLILMSGTALDFTFGDYKVLPKTVIYDVNLTLTLPPHISGPSGMNAMARIMGFLLICIGVQFMINGVLDVVRLARAV